MNTKNVALALLTTSMLSVAAHAAAPAPTPVDDSFFAGKVTGSVGAVSNYVFRGITQTGDGPAIQGNIDYVFDHGLKLGVWGSNVDFPAADATSEFDLYAAYSRSWDAISAEVGVIYYAYPNAMETADLDYVEPYVSLGYDFGLIAFIGSFAYSPDFTGGTGEATYSRLAAKVPLPYDFTLDGWIGYQSIDKNAIAALPDYTDWAVGLAYAINEFTIKAQYTDTDIGAASCSGTDNCDEKATVSVFKSF